MEKTAAEMAGVHEAEQRLAGQDGPDFVTRMCSRFWMGQPTCRGNTS